MEMLMEQTNEQLNPKIWEDEQLRPEVAEALIKIKDKFVSGLTKLDIPINVLDTWIVGSNASYNYSNKSDIDLHIIVDVDKLESPSLTLMLYNYYKSSFNDKYNITIRGIPVELYVQSRLAPIISKGIYSVDKKEWIRFPKRKEEPEVDIQDSLDFMVKKYNQVVELNNKDMAQSLLDTLHMNRERSLVVEGEYGIDNLIFKHFRNNGYIQTLKDIIINGENYDLSLENLKERLCRR